MYVDSSRPPANAKVSDSLSRRPKPPNFLKHTLEILFWRKAHGSISVQERQPFEINSLVSVSADANRSARSLVRRLVPPFGPFSQLAQGPLGKRNVAAGIRRQRNLHSDPELKQFDGDVLRCPDPCENDL